MVLPLSIFCFSFFVRRKKKAQNFPATSLSEKALKLNQSTSLVGKRTNVRFFSSALIAGVLLGMILILLPVVGVLELALEERPVGRTASMTVFVVLLALVAILYCVKKKDVSWLRTFRTEEKP